MRGKVVIACLALVAGAAPAQVPGVPTLPAGGAGRALDGATGQLRGLDEAARDDSREAAKRLDRRDAAVAADARVSRGTRCYAADDKARASPYDPAWRDGYYYCEPAGPGVAAGARVRTGG